MTTQDHNTPEGNSSGVVFIIHPHVLKGTRAETYEHATARLQEAIGLAEAINLEVAGSRMLTVKSIRPNLFLGQGQVDDLKGELKHLDVALVVMDIQISPVQQRNLEKAWGVKVIDRTELILEIFGERARTAEGRLQVELAALTHQRSRLVRAWTHLERQRGGFGFMGGPGESQIEMDRRIIDDRIVKIKKELQSVVRTRKLHRRARERVPYPIVALVGYTNAGKSTLFNRMTKSEVLAKDMLFATLDPTMRRVDLPSGREVILSDTVGFISDLPTSLVAAFRATLEEVLEADLVLHVRDIAHPNTEQQSQDVMEILGDLGLKNIENTHLIEVLNKSDLLSRAERDALLHSSLRAEHPEKVVVSAITGDGLEDLYEKIENFFLNQEEEFTFTLNYEDGARLAWLYQNGVVLDRKDHDEGITISVKLSQAAKARFTRL